MIEKALASVVVVVAVTGLTVAWWIAEHVLSPLVPKR